MLVSRQNIVYEHTPENHSKNWNEKRISDYKEKDTPHPTLSNPIKKIV